MNRERKYRAWDGASMYLSPALSEGAHHLARWFEGHSKYGLFNEESLFMDWTGLVDKKGKEIYEGDIYLAERGYMPSRGYKKKEFPDKIKVVCVVEWSNYDAGWRGRELFPIKEHIDFDANAPYHYFFTSLSGSQTGVADWLEIIGNIHENPELLKEATNG
jgi:hypothetical protein